MDAAKFTAEVRSITEDESKAKIFEDFVSLTSMDEIKKFVSAFSPSEEIFNRHVSPLLKTFEHLQGQGLQEYVQFDPAIVRGLDYYTGIVFEIFDKHPENRRAVAGGGAYANLLQIFNEPALEGVGIGLGEVPLTDFLTAHQLLPDFAKANVDVLIAYLIPEGEKMAMQLAQDLRGNNFKVEVLFGETKPKKAFTYSDKKNFRFITFIGEDEVKSGEIQVKNLTDKSTTKIKTEEFINLLK